MNGRQIISEYVRRALRDPALRDEENVFEMGVVNSLFAMELISLLERSFGLQVQQEDMDLRNFCSIDAMTAFVERKQKYADAGAKAGCTDSLGDLRV